MVCSILLDECSGSEFDCLSKANQPTLANKGRKLGFMSYKKGGVKKKN